MPSKATNEIQRIEPTETAITHPAGGFNAAIALQAIIDKGITSESVEVMKSLVSMQREQEADHAKKACFRAFAALQDDCETIAPTKAIPLKSGAVKSKYAPYEEIYNKIKPLLRKHGFSVSFNQEIDDKGRTSVECILRHDDGHEMRGTFTVRAHKAVNNTEAQDDGGTFTFAKRYALCAMLNIVISTDNDARLPGEEIDEEYARNLEARVRAVASSDDDARRLLALTGAVAFTLITTDRVGSLVRELERREALRTQTNPKTELVRLVTEWSGFTGKSDIEKACRRVFAACKLPTDAKLSEAQAQTALDWVRKCMASDSSFEGSC